MERSSYDVFVSYAHSDSELLAARIVSVFKSLGLVVWFDRTAISVGDSIGDKLREALDECRFAVVILSPAYLQRPWTREELRILQARQISEQRKLILPIRHLISETLVARTSTGVGDLAAVCSADGFEVVISQLLIAMGRSDLLVQLWIDESLRSEVLLSDVLFRHIFNTPMPSSNRRATERRYIKSIAKRKSASGYRRNRRNCA